MLKLKCALKVLYWNNISNGCGITCTLVQVLRKWFSKMWKSALKMASINFKIPGSSVSILWRTIITTTFSLLNTSNTLRAPQRTHLNIYIKFSYSLSPSVSLFSLPTPLMILDLLLIWKSCSSSVVFTWVCKTTQPLAQGHLTAE